jgi:hypothetical protein
LIRDTKIAVFPRLASSYSAARDGLQTRRSMVEMLARAKSSWATKLRKW